MKSKQLPSRHLSCDKSGGTFKPQLTSLIDVMTILLVFLIKSFSVEGNLVTQSDNLALPISNSKVKPDPVTTIEISRNSIIAEGTILAEHGSFVSTDSMVIPELLTWLSDRNGKFTRKNEKEIMIQSDREIEFNIVKRVMYTCSKAGYSDFSVLVIEEG